MATARAVAVTAAASSFFVFMAAPWAVVWLVAIWRVAYGWWLVATWLVACGFSWLVAGGGGTGTAVFSTLRRPLVSSWLRTGLGGGSAGPSTATTISFLAFCFWHSASCFLLIVSPTAKMMTSEAARAAYRRNRFLPRL